MIYPMIISKYSHCTDFIPLVLSIISSCEKELRGHDMLLASWLSNTVEQYGSRTSEQSNPILKALVPDG